MPGNSFPSKLLPYGSYQWFQSQLGQTSPDGGGDPSSFNKGMRNFLHNIINRGARRVYVLDDFQDGVIHTWSFLKTRFELQIKTGVSEYRLPDDCQSVEGDLAFDVGDDTYTPVTKTTVDEILKQRSENTTTTSHPLLYAETFDKRDGQTKQNRLLMIYPSPGGDYTANGMMCVNPGDLTDENPYPYGGDFLVETLLASMMALIDPNMEKLYQQRLRAAMMSDEGHNNPEFLGKNLNGRRGWLSNRMENGRYINFDPVTY